jgi:hypothetical protein
VAALSSIIKHRVRPVSLLAAVAISVAASGCRTKVLTDPIIGPNYQVSNVFRKEATLPAQIRRVAVLPLSYREGSALLVSGKDSLASVLSSELTKAGRFEALFVDPAQLKQWTGREHWDAYEALPPSLFKLLAEKTGADAVLFPTLAEYKPYPPIMIGWRMKLVGNDTDILWAVDQMFDASELAVSNAARRYDRDHVRSSPVLEDSRSILLSPTRFGQYTLDAVLETLPNR